jgi:3-hydroxybutyryl-CoA dehydratase
VRWAFEVKNYRWTELEVGLEESFEADISQEMVDAFTALCGDRNPLHVDSVESRRRGFAGVVVHGMLTASLYSTLAGMHLPGEYCLLHGVDASFLKPVYIGDRLKIIGTVTYLNEAYRQAQIAGRIERGLAGEIVSRAKIKVGLYE